MDGRLEELDLPPTTPLRPARLGRGLPVPPVVALVAVISVLAGIALGYRFVPRPDPLPSSSPATTEVALVESPSPSGSDVPFVAPESSPTAYEVPPTGGLTLSEALAALNRSGTALRKLGRDVPESAVIYARAERWGPMPSLVDAPEQWVWAIAISGSFVAQPLCGSAQQSPQPCSSQPTTTMVILNYNTGAYLEAWSPAFP